MSRARAETCPGSPFVEAVSCAFFGGRFETSRVGPVPEELHYVFEIAVMGGYLNGNGYGDELPGWVRDVPARLLVRQLRRE